MHRSHRWGHRFESCQDHKKQAMLLENKAKSPKSRCVAETLNSLPRNQGGVFLNLLGVAKVLRIRWPKAQLLRSRGRKFESLCAHTNCWQSSLHNASPFPQCFIDQLMDTRPKCQGALCQMIELLTCFYIPPNCWLKACAWLVKRVNEPKTSSAPWVQTPSGPPIQTTLCKFAKLFH